MNQTKTQFPYLVHYIGYYTAHIQSSKEVKL